MSLRLLTFVLTKPGSLTLPICEFFLPIQLASGASIFLNRIMDVAAILRTISSAVMQTFNKVLALLLQEMDSHTTACGTTEQLPILVLNVF